MVEKKELKKVEESTELAMSYANYGALGLEDIDMADVAQPRIVINQALSPLVVEGKAPVGTMSDNLTSRVLGNEIIIQPIKYFKSRIKWIDRLSGGGIDCRSYDGKNGTAYGDCVECEFRKWSTEEPPECDEIHNFLCRVFIPDDEAEMLAVVSFSKTSYKSGKMLLSKISADSTLFSRPMFAKSYKLYTKMVKNDKGVFYIFDTDGGKLVEKDDFKKGADMYKSFASVSAETIAEKVDYNDETTSGGFDGEDEVQF